MPTTHALAGGFLGVTASFLVPGDLGSLVIAGMIGGVLPDLDILVEHRKTLHRPLEFNLVLALLLLGYVVFQQHFLTLSILLASGLVLHVVLDVMSQGKTMNPSLRKDDRCVYNHLQEEWVAPKRWVPVGSWKDLMLSAVFATPLIYLTGPYVSLVSFFMLSVSLGYFLVSDRLTEALFQDFDRFSEVVQQKIGRGPENS